MVAACLTTALGLGVTVGLAATPAAAVDGPAPAPTTRTVISDVHTDAIATFWDSGQLVLASKADTPALGTRYEADDVWFHVDDDSRMTSWPGGVLSFVAPVGATVWLAPMVQAPDQIWPGFSTEAVTPGTIDGDNTTLTLVGVDGPGDVEAWTTGAFGGVGTRLWSSDEDFKSFTLGRVHMHANWAFTQPGIYELTVRADATAAGVPVTDTTVYTFIVGELPEPVLTTTELSVSATELTVGDAVTLSATVSPAGVEEIQGAVEFRDGATVLGHDPIDDDGAADLTVSGLGIGERTVTAAFVPATTNLATGSTSPSVTITVTDGSGAPFGITGVQASYRPGDTLTAHAAGVTLEPDQRLRWLWRVAGEETHSTGDPADSFSRVVSASDDGYELGLSVWQCAEFDEFCNSIESTMVAQSPWVPITVTDIGAPILAELTSPASVYYGDTATIDVSGRELAPGETLELVQRDPSGPFPDWTNDILHVSEDDTISVFLQAGGDLAVRVIDDSGVAVAQSDPMPVEVLPYEVQVAGVRGVYRPGSALEAQGIVHPENAGLRYRWAFFVPGGMEYRVVEEGSGPDALTAEIPDLTLEHDRGILFFEVLVPLGAPFVETTEWVGASQTNVRVVVQDIDPGQQIFQFQTLGDHYHQGNPISLVLGADPEPAADDQVLWEWLWPGTDWAELPGASGLRHELIAEQSLNGVQIRATLDFAGEEAESVVAGPVTIFNDDHGAPPRQQPAVGGATSYTEGESLALRRELPADGPTVLTGHRWERRAAGSAEWSALDGQTGAELAMGATIADDGASYRVSILTPNGEVAYGPSAPVTVTVTEETATELAIAGVAGSYDVGDVLHARVVGRTLETGQSWRWIIRPIGATISGYVFSGDGSTSEAAQGRLRQLLDVGYDGYEIRARLRQGTSYVTGVDTPWVPLHVPNAAEPITTTFPEGDHYVGEDLLLPLQGRPLAAGETARLAYRYDSPWYVEPTTLAGATLVWRPERSLDATEMVLQVVRDGAVVAQSATFDATVRQREVLVEGIRSVYRVGQTLAATAEVHPVAEALTFRWATLDRETFQFDTIKEGTDATALTLELPMTLDWDGETLYFFAIAHAGTEHEVRAGGWSTRLIVSDADPSEQLFFFEQVSGHYHQGGAINLELVADPELDQTDTITWEWRWPGGGWSPFPAATGAAHQLTAEQALDGVEVRATLHDGATGEALVADAVTIHVDDHGAPDRQIPTIAGGTAVGEGDTVTLTRQLPEGGPTVLTEHRWERQAEGSDEWTVVAGRVAAQLSFSAAAADDGAAYRVSILKPTGEVAYGPSAPVTLSVTAAPDPGPDPGPGPGPGPDPDPDPVPRPPLPSPIASLVPARVLDTRPGTATIDGGDIGAGPLPAGETMVVDVAGRGGVPDGSAAAVLNLTIDQPAGPGFVTVWPCDQPQPWASSVNFDEGWTVANSIITKLSPDGHVCVAASRSTHVVIDVSGFVPSGAGYDAVVPARLADTRAGAASVDGQAVGTGVLEPGEQLVVQVAGRGGVPSDAAAAALNVATTEAPGPGFVTIWPCDQPKPWTSSVNYDTSWTVANAVIAPLAGDGTVCIAAGVNAVHVLVDVTGSFTTRPGIDGFVPARLADTRPSAATIDHLEAGHGPLRPGERLVVHVAGRAGIPDAAGTTMLNVTVTDADAAGYLVVWPCDEPKPGASTINFGPGWTIANAIVARPAPDGTICVESPVATTHVIVDANGYITT